MNIFIIPSWYPLSTNSLPGIFFREQAHALVKHYPENKIGISTWGQNDERLLLWAGCPLKSLSKLLIGKKPQPYENNLTENLTEYFTPAYTWSSKLWHGNMQQIIKANLSHIDKFQSEFGKVDIIHAHVGYPAGYIAKNLSKTHSIPYVITEHMSPFPHKYYLKSSGSLAPRLYAEYNGSSQNIAVSSSLEKQMKKQDIPRTTIIPNLVKDNMFESVISKNNNKAFTFFSLGRMVPQKGIDILLVAFSKMKSKAILRIGGDGESLDIYKNLAGELEIEDKIEWLGELNRNEALLEFQNCDAFVLPSRHESMGVVFAEAMACGKPVIGTISGGPEEFINESNGYLIETENEKMLIKSMEDMIQNYARFDAEHIRQQCADRFSSQVICNKIMALYQDVLQL